MFGNFFKKKEKYATGADVYEIMKLSTFGTAMAFSTSVSNAKYSTSSSVALETVFSIFLARELLLSEVKVLTSFVVRQLKIDSLELPQQDVFLEGYRMATSGVGFISYAREINAGRAGFNPEMVEPAVKLIIDAVQQAFNEEMDKFRLHATILNDIPLMQKEDIPARLVDGNGTPFIPLYVQVIEDLGKLQDREDWGDIEARYILAKRTVLECLFTI